MTYGAFVTAAAQMGNVRRWQRRARFGEVRDLDSYMQKLNADMLAFDAWTVEEQKSGVKTPLGQSYWDAWKSFMNDPPETLESGRLTGWLEFYATTFPSVLPGQVNPGLHAATVAYERELQRFYDRALQAGGAPFIDRPTPAGGPLPPVPPPSNGPPTPVPNGPPAPPTTDAQTTRAGMGAGWLFLIGGAALIVAGYRK